MRISRSTTVRREKRGDEEVFSSLLSGSGMAPLPDSVTSSLPSLGARAPVTLWLPPLVTPTLRMLRVSSPPSIRSPSCLHPVKQVPQRSRPYANTTRARMRALVYKAHSIPATTPAVLAARSRTQPRSRVDHDEYADSLMASVYLSRSPSPPLSPLSGEGEGSPTSTSLPSDLPVCPSLFVPLVFPFPLPFSLCIDLPSPLR